MDISLQQEKKYGRQHILTSLEKNLWYMDKTHTSKKQRNESNHLSFHLT